MCKTKKGKLLLELIREWEKEQDIKDKKKEKERCELIKHFASKDINKSRIIN